MSKLALVLACAALAAVPAAQARQAGPQEQTQQACAHWKNHVFEVCAAYSFWDAHMALQAYYKYVNSDSVFSGLKDIFPKRYKGIAPAQIFRMAGIALWPEGTNTVEGPTIRIISAKASLACNRGVLVTEESWVVRSKKSLKPLYSENRQVHTVVLRRVPGELFVLLGKSLHAWDVYETYKGRRNLPTCKQ